MTLFRAIILAGCGATFTGAGLLSYAGVGAEDQTVQSVRQGSLGNGSGNADVK
jgi:hypothetical protein